MKTLDWWMMKCNSTFGGPGPDGIVEECEDYDDGWLTTVHTKSGEQFTNTDSRASVDKPGGVLIVRLNRDTPPRRLYFPMENVNYWTTERYTKK